MRRALVTEWWKLRRSTVVVVTSALLALALPAMAIGFTLAASSEGDAALARKAAAFIVGEGWEAYLGAVSQIAAVAAFLGAGIVSAWVFAREHVDRTFPSLFALPVSRATIAGAKFVMLIGWVVALTALVSATTVATGLAARVGPALPPAGVIRLSAILLGAGLLGTTAAFVASVGRGYLPAVGFLVVVVAIAQVSVLVGSGTWFPFAVPGLAAVAGAPGAPTIGITHVAAVGVTVTLGIASTIGWWSSAEVR